MKIGVKVTLVDKNEDGDPLAPLGFFTVNMFCIYHLLAKYLLRSSNVSETTLGSNDMKMRRHTRLLLLVRIFMKMTERPFLTKANTHIKLNNNNLTHKTKKVSF